MCVSFQQAISHNHFQWAHSYWSGYFTSRQALKGYVRSSATLLHAAEKLLALNAAQMAADDVASAQQNIDLLTDGLVRA